MRGKQLFGVILVPVSRIIPAHAGQTTPSVFLPLPLPDHPRACGANTGKDAEKHFKDGSSPRMRGKHASYGFIQAFSRIIPAHAGQTECGTRARGRRTDHPRACGANTCKRACCRVRRGSSPRMRGKQPHIKPYRNGNRIIPAHAGQTHSSPFLSLSFADHPRACGANGTVNGVNQRQHGSSPRMRGKRRRHGRISGRPRIIPAHAGQTRGGGLSFISVPDHPRACGANAMLRYRCSFRCGSSPRMRGKHP